MVIPSYQRTETLRKAVLSVFAQDLPKSDFELVVVDSSPAEENSAMLAGLAASAPCAFRYFHKSSEGPGPSRNLGVEKARAPLIAFMDSDCQAHPGWLRGGVAAFEEGIGLVQGKTLPDPGSRTGVLTWYVRIEHENFIYECANMFYRRDALIAAGGFPRPDLTPNAVSPMGGEDVELAWRVRRLGWKSRFAGDAVVYHEVVPITPWRWLFAKRLYIWPLIARNVPEVRRFFCARYFFDRSQALLFLAILGIGLAMVSTPALALVLPYAVLRASEKTASLRGPLRVLRVLFYFPRDVIAFFVLLAGSIRYRTLLL